MKLDKNGKNVFTVLFGLLFLFFVLMVISINANAKDYNKIDYQELLLVNGGSVEFCKYEDDFSKHSFTFSLSKTNGEYGILMYGVIPRPYVETSIVISPELITALKLVKDNIGYSYSDTIKQDDARIMYGVLGMNDVILFMSDNLAVNYNIEISKSQLEDLTLCVGAINELTKKLNGDKIENN